MKNKNKFSQLIHKCFFEKPDKVKEDNQHIYIIQAICMVFGVIIHTSWIPLFWFLGVKPLFLFNFISTSAWMIGFYFNRKGLHLSATALTGLEVYLHQSLCAYFIGWDTGFQYYILIVPMFIFLMPQGNNLIKFILTIIGFLNYLTLYHFLYNSEPLFMLDQSTISFFYYFNATVFVLLLCFCCYFFSEQIFSAQKALKKEKNKVKNAYSLISKYVPPQVVDTISDGKIDLIWKHNRKKLTMFFSDIKNFTKITDALEPEDMAKILNEYLTEMNSIINKYGGTLAQVIGDGLYVFFGAPNKTNDKDHAVRCSNMAIDMQFKMKKLNQKWFSLGIDEELEIRCGINTGMATVGGYGSSDRKEYTAMGMQVNIAARLESACTPGKILINHTTWVLIKDDISCLEKGEIEIQGYHLPVKVYEIQVRQTH